MNNWTKMEYSDMRDAWLHICQKVCENQQVKFKGSRLWEEENNGTTSEDIYPNTITRFSCDFDLGDDEFLSVWVPCEDFDKLSWPDIQVKLERLIGAQKMMEKDE